MSGKPSVITLSYGKFTCSFTRTEEAEALTTAIMGQIADIVRVNPNFGSAASAPAPTEAMPAPKSEPAQLKAVQPQQSFEPTDDRFDSEVSFMRSPNANATDADPDARLAARYDALRSTVIKMLSDASEALEALDPVSATPSVAPISEPLHDEVEHPATDLPEEEAPFDPFANIPAEEMHEFAPEEPAPLQAQEAAPNTPPITSFDQDRGDSAITAELAPDNETTVYRLIPTT